jgi:hypothetical protein
MSATSLGNADSLVPLRRSTAQVGRVETVPIIATNPFKARQYSGDVAL